MLVLSRKIGEAIVIGDGIRIVVVSFAQGRVKIGIEAPESTLILREELFKVSVQDAVEEAAKPEVGGEGQEQPTEGASNA